MVCEHPADVMNITKDNNNLVSKEIDKQLFYHDDNSKIGSCLHMNIYKRVQQVSCKLKFEYWLLRLPFFASRSSASISSMSCKSLYVCFLRPLVRLHLQSYIIFTYIFIMN